MSTASADYYIVQEKATKKCKVVETRPTETTWIQIGPVAFKTLTVIAVSAGSQHRREAMTGGITQIRSARAAR
jgi:hypothetical protein